MESMSCLPPKLLLILKNSLATNYTVNTSIDHLSCDRNQLDELRKDLEYSERGLDFYAYVTPFIIIIGVLGNAVILAVFMSKAMRKMSASYYLASLALSDTCVLLSYVFIDWLQKGLHQWPGKYSINLVSYKGICETFLFITYGFRFMSVWLIVIFTLERYIGVCHPLHRRGICTRKFAKSAIGCVVITSFLISMYKPIISEARETEDGSRICAWKAKHGQINFILDIVYALMITAVPFTILTFLNILITRALLLTRKRHKKVRFSSDDSTSVVKLEFTCLLLVVSTCFIALNLPYFIVWCMRLHNEISRNPNEHLRGTLYICKTIFSFNYCINFFLYSLTGINFRRQLKSLFGKGIRNDLPHSMASKTMYSQVSMNPTVAASTPRSSLNNGITTV